MKGKILTIEQIKERCHEIFQNADYIEKAYLFGSYARNEAKIDSDLDFMIVLNRFVGAKYFRLYDLIQEEFERKVDILTEEEALRIMPRSIERDKVMIYEREN